jgi:hypothetical protein
MNESSDKLEPHLQRMVNAGVSGIDILHGELKNLMLIAEQEYTECVRIEEENDYSDAMESMDRTRAEGLMDAYTHIYKLTYDISFAIADKEASNGNV